LPQIRGTTGVFDDEARYPAPHWRLERFATVAPQQLRQLGDIGGDAPGFVAV
jgi:hypothetical protein